MNVQPYSEASEQRLQLRRDLIERLQQLRDTTAALGVAAPGVPSAPVSPLSQEALPQIDPLCSAARSLTTMLRRNQLEIAAAEQALRVARAKALRLRLLAAGLGVLAVLTAAAALLLLRPV